MNQTNNRDTINSKVIRVYPLSYKWKENIPSAGRGTLKLLSRIKRVLSDVANLRKGKMLLLKLLQERSRISRFLNLPRLLKPANDNLGKHIHVSIIYYNFHAKGNTLQYTTWHTVMSKSMQNQRESKHRNIK